MLRGRDEPASSSATHEERAGGEGSPSYLVHFLKSRKSASWKLTKQGTSLTKARKCRLQSSSWLLVPRRQNTLVIQNRPSSQDCRKTELGQWLSVSTANDRSHERLPFPRVAAFPALKFLPFTVDYFRKCLRSTRGSVHLSFLTCRRYFCKFEGCLILRVVIQSMEYINKHKW